MSLIFYLVHSPWILLVLGAFILPLLKCPSALSKSVRQLQFQQVAHKEAPYTWSRAFLFLFSYCQGLLACSFFFGKRSYVSRSDPQSEDKNNCPIQDNNVLGKSSHEGLNSFFERHPTRFYSPLCLSENKKFKI